MSLLNLKKWSFLVFCVILSAACQSTSVDNQISSGPDGEVYAETRPGVRDREELTVVFSKTGVELDFRKSYMASEAQLYTAIYEGLFSYHPINLSPVPASAEKWELSEDKKEWTFTIRQNAQFWNGDPLRAEDFRAAWLSLLSMERESPYSSLFDIIEGAYEYRTGKLKDPEKVGISAPDEKTLVVKLNSPASFFMAMLCHHSFSPIHPSMLKKQSWWELPLVSNGPFKIESASDDSIVLAKSENYWDSNYVPLKKIIVKYAATGEEASELWNSGEGRWIAGDVNIETLTDRSGIQRNAMFATHYYFIRCAEKPWNDKRVRRALALVLPWEEIRAGYALPAQTLIYPIDDKYPRVEGVKTNFEEAVELMAEAGYEDGKGAPELVIRLNPSSEASRLGSIMASTWVEKLGINVRVEIVPFNRYFQAMKEGGYTIGSTTWIGDFADPYTFLQMWRKDSNLNDAWYNDDDYEELIEKSMTQDGNARLATLADAEKLLLDRGVVLPIAYSPAQNIIDHRTEIGGWYLNALDIHPFKYLFFKAYRPLPMVVKNDTNRSWL